MAVEDIEKSNNLGPGVLESVTIMEDFTDFHMKSRPPEICSIRILIWDSEEKCGKDSICVTYRFGDKHTCLPESIKNSERSPHTPYMAVDDIERSKNLGP